ncbi:MAG TPA: hypothetical protein VIK96_02340 [Bacilli bacterium]
MKKYFKIGSCLILVIALILLLSACNSSKLSIKVSASKALAGETVALIPNFRKSENYQITWYEKTADGQWLEKENTSDVLYVRDNFGGIHEFKAVLKTGEKQIESEVVTVEFVDTTGKVFGNSPTGILASSNIDFSHDDGSENAKIIHKAANRIKDEYAFFKEIYSTRYVISAEVDIIGINGSDPYPKTGLLAARLNDRLIYFAFDSRPNFNFGDIVVVENTPTDGGTWKWPGIVNNLGMAFRDANGNRITHTMTVVRDVETFYFLVDGIVITTKTFTGLTQPTLAGTYTMAQHAEFKNYYAYSDNPDVTDDQYDLILRSVLNLVGGE